jgi:hypothetical protein
MRMSGTIEKADGNVLSLKSSDGAAVKLTFTENAMIIAVVKASMADIKEGTFLGSAAMPQPDGSQKALEVHIFPEQMRGTGEGHRPYAPVPNSTMTNGAASGAMVAGVDGSTMVVKYKDGEKKIVVPPNYCGNANRDEVAARPFPCAVHASRNLAGQKRRSDASRGDGHSSVAAPRPSPSPKRSPISATMASSASNSSGPSVSSTTRLPLP